MIRRAVAEDERQLRAARQPVLQGGKRLVRGRSDVRRGKGFGGNGCGAWRGGCSQLRGSSWIATSTPASSHQPNALRASATPITISFPTHRFLSGIDAMVKEQAVHSSRNVFGSRQDEEERMSERESMAYDVVIVGAGPAGLSAAIRLKQLANEAGREISVCILEKGSEVGAHILSGAVVDPKALDELIPDWKDKGSPLTVPVIENHHWVLTKKRQVRHARNADAAVHAQ